jgi:hypothetical protein
MFSSINAVFHAAVPSDHPQAPGASLSALEKLVGNDSFANFAGIGKIGGIDHLAANEHIGAMTQGGWDQAIADIDGEIH